MSRRKLRKSKQKWKRKKEDKSKIISCVEEECVAEKSEPCVGKREDGESTGRKHKTSKQVNFAVLPDKYQPLEEDRISDTAQEENHREKYKRFRKNFGKALRYTWKCLVVGMQSFSTSYSGPLSAASTLVPEVSRTKGST